MSTHPESRSRRLYLSPPHMSEEGVELEYVRDAFASNWIAPLGPHVDAFEQEFAAYLGVEHAAALSSGTAALHLALIALGVSRGDEVLCSTFTFAATANAITYVGATPVFVDSEARTWNMDPGLLADALRRRAAAGRLPRAVVVVDVIGQSADWIPILECCREYGVPVVEDAAEALGAFYRGTKVGAFGDIAVFSFNGNKIMTTSSGGMLVSSSSERVAQTRFLATQARDPAPHYEHSRIGFNYRMSNVLAAIGRGQLRVLDRRVAKRRRLYGGYVRRLADLPGVTFMPEAEGCESTRWLTSLLIDPAEFGCTRDDVRCALEEHDIESRPLWKPMHLQPVFAGCEAIGGAVSAQLFERGLSLPSGTALEDADLDRISGIVRATHRRCSAGRRLADGTVGARA